MFGQTVLIRRGGVFAKGDTREVLTSESLSSFFETSVEVKRQNQRAWISIP